MSKPGCSACWRNRQESSSVATNSPTGAESRSRRAASMCRSIGFAARSSRTLNSHDTFRPCADRAMSSAPIETADRTSDAKPERLGIGARIKSFLPRTIEGRTLAIIVIPVFIAQILTPILFFERHFSSLSRGLAFAVAGDIATIIDDMEREPSNQRQIFADARRTLELTVDLEPGATLAPRVGPRWNPLIEPVLMTALQERVGLPFTIGSSGADEAAEIRVQLPQGVLDVLAPQHRLFSYTAFVFIGWVIGVPIVLTWIAIIFMRNQVRPIRRLAVAAESFGRGVDTVRLRPAGALEVRQAAAA